MAKVCRRVASGSVSFRNGEVASVGVEKSAENSEKRDYPIDDPNVVLKLQVAMEAIDGSRC